jgi:hypothetical protein
LGHKINQEPSSSSSSSAYRTILSIIDILPIQDYTTPFPYKVGNAAVGPLLAEEGMPCLQNENYPIGLTTQPPMRNEAATINMYG